MNCVERIKAICKERKLPISRLEKELGFANGYFNQLRKGTLPADRLRKVANKLDVSEDFLLYGEETAAEEKDELVEYLEYLRTRPEMRMLFKVAKDATKEDVEQAVKIIEALRK
jgi:transcriptional regulator with XRE-family HTH domain